MLFENINLKEQNITILVRGREKFIFLQQIECIREYIVEVSEMTPSFSTMLSKAKIYPGLTALDNCLALHHYINDELIPNLHKIINGISNCKQYPVRLLSRRDAVGGFDEVD